MFASFFGSLLRRSAPAAIDNDPREPACDDAPRTPTNEWKLRSQCDVFDPRSPTLGIRRSPLSKARLWTFETQEPIVTASMQTVEKQKEEEFIIERAASVVAPEESLVAAVLPDVDAELVKLRQEFSAKKENAPPTRTATPIRDAKMFLSSPALWKTLTSSPQLFEQSPKTVSDPLLPNNNWQMHPGSRRTLFSRSDSASAA